MKAPVLHRQRLVEPPLLVQQRRPRSAVARVPSIVRAGSPGTRWIEEEDEDRDAEDDRDHLQQAPSAT